MLRRWLHNVNVSQLAPRTQPIHIALERLDEYILQTATVSLQHTILNFHCC